MLVPLFRETKVLPGLIQSLRELDYPPAKLEIMLVVEAVDLEIQATLQALDLPGSFRTLVVPDQEPRTKPKALNYALQFARGDFVVVYDAEDRPEPDQLRRALEIFKGASPKLGCLQAQLNIYNAKQSWLTRQFTIEYSVLFDAILPALERLRLPVPLGGTSNHFPRASAGRESAPGTRSTSPRTPTSAFVCRGAGFTPARSPRRRGRRPRPRSAAG